ncbi:hypothetical protein KQ878_03610 [Mycoplasma zalophidermidis]|uniref:HNH endonuclease n=1 Tax=Mycoplasma zalophidermidis TaxID=398174 RepID=A0ABS6DSS1_9MOLU|nr:hypothetical protein [Mycoplasma zalophidermidis]
MLFFIWRKIDCEFGGIDINHILPYKLNEADSPEMDNFTITHASCLRSKQTSDLNLAKLISKYKKIR